MYFFIKKWLKSTCENVILNISVFFYEYSLFNLAISAKYDKINELE